MTSGRSRRQDLAEEPQEVPVEDRAYVVIGVAAILHHFRELLQIGDRVEVGRALVATETAVEVTADPDVASVAGKLADMIILSDDIFTIDPNKITDVKVLTTVVGGKVVFELK